MKQRAQYTCPLELTHDITRGKWKPILLWQLGKGAQSPAELQRGIEGIGQKMLLEQLGELQAFDMVEREQAVGYPLRVTYRLTARGTRMLEAVSILQEIGVELMLEDGREDFLREKGLFSKE